MENIYRVICSRVTNTGVAISENAKGRWGKSRHGATSRRKASLAAVSLAVAAFAHAGQSFDAKQPPAAAPAAPKCLAPQCVVTAVGVTSHPTGGQVVSGIGSISESGNTTTVRQSSADLSLDWLSFNIGSQETVNFLQPSASAIAVNRIFGTSGSQILGHLDANGQVWLINPNGVVFGHGAQVNVGGLVASTLDVSDVSLSGNTTSFGGNGRGSVVNQGAISAANGGYIALLGNHVSNQGTITAKLGTVALGAGSATTLTFSGNSLVKMQVDQSTLNNLAENGGLIQADGGTVVMSAGAKNALLASVVNNTGVIEARTVENHNGTVELLGGMTAGTVNVGGTLDASAPAGGDGGFIETNAAHVEVANDAKVTTLAAAGKTGTWLIDPTDFTVAPSGGDLTGATLSTDLNSTNTTILSSNGASPVTGGGSGGNININDTVSWSANTTLTLTAANNVNVNANMTATGNTAGLVINPNTTNGSQTATSSGAFNLAMGNSITLSGTNPSLSIGGNAYTVINSLGAAGSTTGTDLQGINGNLSGYYALGSNINATATSTWNSGAGFTPIGGSSQAFTGTFDALGHTISSLTINQPSATYVGLFGDTGASSVIRNVGLVGGTVSGYEEVGGLVGFNGGSISNSYATGSVSGNHGAYAVGGLVGYNVGSISNSYATGNVYANGVEVEYSGSCGNGCNYYDYEYDSPQSVGGLVGFNGGSISNSYATGSVSGNDGANAVGGLVGYNVGSIRNSYATGSVQSGSVEGEDEEVVQYSYSCGFSTCYGYDYYYSYPYYYAYYTGGLVGYNGGGSISNSYAANPYVEGYYYVGGLVGANYNSVTNSYATGSVSGASEVGGLVGYNSGGSVDNSFWDTTTSGQSSSAGGTGMTTAQMQQQANFTSATTANGNVNPGWDLTNTWVMYNGYTFPLLQSFMTPLTVTANNAATTYDKEPYSGGNGVTYSTTPNGNLLGTVSYGGTSQGAINAGGYTITPAGLYSNQQGYIISYVNGTLTVNPLALTGAAIAAGNSTYGSSVTPGAVSFSNVIAGDVVSATASIASPVLSTSGHLAAGSYAQSASATLSGANAGDYTFAGFTTATANYTVAQLALTGAAIAAANSTYGSTVTPGAVSFSNVVGTDVVSATASIATPAVLSTSGHVPAGSYTQSAGSTLSGADAGDYTFAGFTTATANYTVAQLALTGAAIAAANSTYGSTVTPGAVSFSNVVGTDVVSATASIATPAVLSTSGHVPAGSYTQSAGSTLSGADAGDYTFAGFTTATANYTVAQLALTGAAIAAANSTYGSTVTPGAVSFSNVVGTDVVSATASIATPAVLSTSGHVPAGSYTQSAGSTLSGADAGDYTFAGFTTATANYTINPLALTAAIAAGNSTYGSALNPGAVTLSGVITGDLVSVGGATVNTSTLSTSGHSVAGSYTQSAGSTLSGADAGDYSFAGFTTATANYTINPLALTAAIAAGNSTYGSALNPGAVTLSGVITGDLVSVGGATVNTSTLSTSGHSVAGSYTQSAGSTLSGADAGDYSFAGFTTATANYTINPLALTAAIAAGNSTYGSALNPGAVTLSGVITGDLVSVGGVTVNTSTLSTSGHSVAGSYTQSAGSTLSGADAGDYSFAGFTTATANYTINPLALTAAIAAGNSTYGSALNPGAVTLSGVITGDLVSVGGATVNTSTLSTSGHSVAGSYTQSAGSTLSGADAGDYSFAGFTTATANYTINPLALTAAIAAGNSTYGSAVIPGAVSFTNVISGDAVGSTASLVSPAYSTSGHLDAGSYAQTASTLSGTDAGNYSFAGYTTPTNNYTVAQLALTGAAIAAGNSSYGSTVMPGAVSFSNEVAGDGILAIASIVNPLYSASHHLDAGSYAQMASALSGPNVGNYSFVGSYTTPTDNYTVSQLALTVTGLTGTNKVYNGTTADPLHGTAAIAPISGDVVHLGGTGSGSFANANVGTALPVTVSGYSLTGADAGNYLLVEPTGLTANITRLASVAWVGGSSGNWSLASNWAGGAIPDYANVAAVTIPASDTVTYDSGVPGATTLTTLTNSGNLVMAAGNLSTTGALSTAGYEQSGGTLNVGGALTIHSVSGGVTLGTITAGSLSLTSSAGAITQLASTTLDVTGTSSLTAPSYGITLANTSNIFGGAVTSSGSNIDLLQSTGGLKLGNTIATGTLTVMTERGAITQSASTAVDVSGATNLSAVNLGANPGVANITLANSTNDFVGPVTASGLNINLLNTSGAGLILGNTTASGTLTLSSVGPITQSASTAVNVTGATSLTATNYGITLANASNSFEGAVTSTGSNIDLVDSSTGGLKLGNTIATGTFTADSTAGTITQSGSTAVNVTGTSSLTANNGMTGTGAIEYGITLANTTNNFGGAVTANGSAITLDEAGALTVVLDSTGASSLTSVGALIVSGTVGTSLTTTTTGTSSATTFEATTVGTTLKVTSTGAVTETSPNILTVDREGTTTVSNKNVTVNGVKGAEIP